MGLAWGANVKIPKERKKCEPKMGSPGELVLGSLFGSKNSFWGCRFLSCLCPSLVSARQSDSFMMSSKGIGFLCVFTYQRQAGNQTETHAYRYSHMNQCPYFTPPWPKGTGHVSSVESQADAALGVHAKREAAMRRCSRARLYFFLPASRRHHKLFGFCHRLSFSCFCLCICNKMILVGCS